MTDFDKLRKETLEFEFSVVILNRCMSNEQYAKLPASPENKKEDVRLTMLLKDTLPGIIKNAEEEKFELIIVDNGSGDHCLIELINFQRSQPNCRLILNGNNTGCSGGWNQGLKLARGEYICFCASDYIVKTPNFLKILQEPMLKDPLVAETGPRVAVSNSECLGMAFNEYDGCEVTYVALDCGMLKKSALEKIGYIDEMLYPYMGEDQELGLALCNAGYKVIKKDLPDSIHLGQQSIGLLWSQFGDNPEVTQMWERNKAYMKNKYKEYFNRRMLERGF